MKATRTEFLPLGISCVHCGGRLSARRVIDGSIQVKGLHKLEYVHTKTANEECTVTYRARPYDGWAASATFDEALTRTGADK